MPKSSGKNPDMVTTKSSSGMSCSPTFSMVTVASNSKASLASVLSVTSEGGEFSTKDILIADVPPTKASPGETPAPLSAWHPAAIKRIPRKDNNIVMFLIPLLFVKSLYKSFYLSEILEISEHAQNALRSDISYMKL